MFSGMRLVRMNEPETMRRIFAETRTIGLSESPGRASGPVARHMQRAGYRIVPVNPNIESALGEKAYPTLDAACSALRAKGVKVDLVNVFRAASYVPGIVDDVIRNQISALWLQLGVCHEEAAQRAEDAGALVVMDHCLMVEHANYGG
jgi:predicted CoA-binding protein